MKAAALALALLVAGCAGTGLDKARVTVTTTVKVEGDVEDAILSVVQAKQKELVAKVVSGEMTPEQAQAAYDVWRGKLNRVISALTTLHDALKAAAHAIDASEAVKTKSYTAAISDVGSALASLVQALADAGVHIPGVS